MSEKTEKTNEKTSKKTEKKWRMIPSSLPTSAPAITTPDDVSSAVMMRRSEFRVFNALLSMKGACVGAVGFGELSGASGVEGAELVAALRSIDRDGGSVVILDGLVCFDLLGWRWERLARRVLAVSVLAPSVEMRGDAIRATIEAAEATEAIEHISADEPATVAPTSPGMEHMIARELHREAMMKTIHRVRTGMKGLGPLVDRIPRALRQHLGMNCAIRVEGNDKGDHANIIVTSADELAAVCQVPYKLEDQEDVEQLKRLQR